MAEIAAGTVNLPGIGRVKKTYVYLGVAGVTGAVVYYYYKRSHAGPAQAVTAMVTDPDGNQCPALGASGYCPGTPNDLAATTPGTGGGGASGSGIIGYDGHGNPIYGTSTGDQVTSGPPFTSNAAWTQYAFSVIGGSQQDGGTALMEALGLYISGGDITPAQQSLINQAIAVAGYPPVAGANGMPPAMNLVSAPPAPTTAAVPSVIGMSFGDAAAAIAAAGLVAAVGTGTEPVTGQSPNAGTRVDLQSTVTISGAVAGLPNPGWCPSGYLYSATHTGSNGEIPATDGAGWCEVKPAGTGGGGGGGGGTPPPSKWAFPAPAGLHSYSASHTGYRIGWSAVRGPQGQVPKSYTVATYDHRGNLVDQFTPAGTATAEYGRGGKGLPPGTYHTNVWANGGPIAPKHATVYVTIK